jgi:hypothetical protein
VAGGEPLWLALMVGPHTAYQLLFRTRCVVLLQVDEADATGYIMSAHLAQQLSCTRLPA